MYINKAKWWVELFEKKINDMTESVLSFVECHPGKILVPSNYIEKQRKMNNTLFLCPLSFSLCFPSIFLIKLLFWHYLHF